MYQIPPRAGQKRQPSDEQVKAGIAAFGVFGFLNSVDKLAGGDVTKWADVMALPWEFAITKLQHINLQSEYEENYSEIMRKKNEAKK